MLASAANAEAAPSGGPDQTVFQAVGEQFAADASAEPVMSLLAQADVVPTPRDRSRAEPATPTPSPLPEQGEPLDLFGPLPTSDSNAEQPFLPESDVGRAPLDETLVLPQTTPNDQSVPATSDPFATDPFTPEPIPGTGPEEPPQPPATASPVRTRGPARPAPEPPANSGNTTLEPPATTPLPDQPFPDLFLPEEQTPPTSQPSETISEPVFPTTTGEPSDPFPTPDTSSTPAPNTPSPRIRGAPARTNVDPMPVESPIFEPQPTRDPAATFVPEPSRRAPASSPTDAFPIAEDNRGDSVLPPQTYPDQPLTMPSPAAPSSSTPLPSFPTPAELGDPRPLPSVATPDPIRSTPPERSSTPFSDSTPIRRSTPTTRPTNIDPFPIAGSLVGSGTVDSTAPAGLQPELQIEKDAPPRAVLHQPLVYNIRVRNVGRNAAHQVVVEDIIPRGSTLKGTIPEAELDPQDKHLIWKLGTLAAGEERLIRVQIVPTEPGEIGSVATVRFVGRIASKTVITAPRIRLEMTGPVETAVGDVPVYRFRLTNVGDGDASNVVVKSTIPDLFQHPSGTELEYEVGSLRAGQTRDIDLALKAVRAGQSSQSVSALVNGREQDRTSADVVVLASRLSIERTGPERRFVNRPANYVTRVTNQSGQPLQSVTIVERLPQGMELAAVPEHGHYDAVRRTITWTIPQLGPQQSHQLRSSLVTSDPGNYATTIAAKDAAGNKAEATSQLEVAGFSSLKVDVAQMTRGGGEIAVGEKVALRMTVANRGSAAASNVVTEFDIPPELEFVAAKPQQYELQDGKVRFAPIPHLDVNGQQVIDIVCVARQPGTPRIAASIWSKEQNQIREEEAVVVFREDP